MYTAAVKNKIIKKEAGGGAAGFFTAREDYDSPGQIFASTPNSHRGDRPRFFVRREFPGEARARACGGFSPRIVRVKQKE